MFVFLCLYLCKCCTPSALPDSVSVQVEIFKSVYLPVIFSSIILVYYAATAVNALISTVRFIPYNVSLNLLPKRERNSVSRDFVKLLYISFVVLMALEESASVVHFVLDVSLLDPICYELVLSMVRINFLLLHTSIRTGTYIVFHHKRIFQPVFCNFELTAFWIFSLLLILSSDVHPNPGPHPSAQNFHSGFLSFCNWNLNTLSKDEFYRVSLLEANNTSCKYDIISLCETSLNDEITVPENALPGYLYHPLNNPSGERNGGVGIFYKDSLPLRVREDLSFDECLVSELRFGHKKIFFTVFYRNPKNCASSPEFGNFLLNFENLHKSIQSEKPYATFYAGDANAHTQVWYPGGDTNAEGVKLDELFSNLNLTQLIDEPTHFFRDDCVPSCIDIILTDQPNLVMSSGVRPSLDPTVKHQMTFCKINFKIPPPPNFRRKIWHFDRANLEAIKKAISSFPWAENLVKLQNPTLQVSLLNKTILNIMSNFVPNEVKTFRPADPPWYTSFTKNLLKKHNKMYRRYKDNGFTENDKKALEDSKLQISSHILEAKEKYLQNQGEKLADPSTSHKTYWKILNGFLNKCKIPRIPPLFVNNTFVTESVEKATIFNNYFAEQCTPFQTGSTLPPLIFNTNNRLSDIDVTAEEILGIIKVLQIKKAHGPDDISVSMIKLCGEGLSIPLQLIFQNIIRTGIFPDQWKEANVTPVHKKKDKQTVSNYRPISLLPLFAKVFEKIIFKHLYNFLITNNLITKNQSGFTPGDSGTNQLLSLIHDVHLAFDDNSCLEVRSVYLDMSKAFDKVWHEGLLHKLKQNGIDGNVLALLTNYLSNRRQRVVLNGKSSDWAPILSGVPQGSVLGPLLFLIFINDLEAGIISQIKFFADDTSLYSVVKDPEKSARELNHDLEVISNWAKQWKMSFNPDPTKPANEILFSHKRKPVVHPPLYFNGVEVKRVTEHKHLGLVLDPLLNFAAHFKEKIAKARKGIGLIKHLRSYLPTHVLEQIYKMHVRSHLDYCDFIYHIPELVNRKKDNKGSDEIDDQESNKSDVEDDESDSIAESSVQPIRINCRMKELESVQYQAALAVTGAWKGSSRLKLYKELGWESLHQRRYFRRITQFFKIMNGLTPQYLVDPVPVPRRHLFGRHVTNDIYHFSHRNNRFLYSFYPDAVNSWNALDPDVRKTDTLSGFKNEILKTIKPTKRSIFNIHDESGIRYIFQLRVGLSPLRAHKKKHNFKDTPNDRCLCGNGIETTEHYLLNCPLYQTQRETLFSAVNPIISLASPLNQNNDLTGMLLYGNEKLNPSQNKLILMATINFVKSTERLSAS